MKNLRLALVLFVASGSILFGNGGAWQTGIPSTGNASASKNDQHTDVTIENEALKIELHPEHAYYEGEATTILPANSWRSPFGIRIRLAMAN